MKIAILGDLHLVSEHDPWKVMIERRQHFAQAWPTFRKMAALIREEAPDLVVIIGDILDWYSPENRDFALELLAEMRTPWEFTPGNHDFSTYQVSEDGLIIPMASIEGYERMQQGWNERGIPLENRVIDAGRAGLVLLDSARGSVAMDAQPWLHSVLPKIEYPLLFSHIPLDTPPMREFIHVMTPEVNVEEDVQHEAPWLYEECVKGRVEHVITGHLHYPGTVKVEQTTMHVMGLSVLAFNRVYRGMGMAKIVELDKGFVSRDIRIAD